MKKRILKTQNCVIVIESINDVNYCYLKNMVERLKTLEEKEKKTKIYIENYSKITQDISWSPNLNNNTIIKHTRFKKPEKPESSKYMDSTNKQ